VLTSRKNAWKQIFIFPLRHYANCVSTTLTVLITLKVSISFIVTLYYNYIEHDLIYNETCLTYIWYVFIYLTAILLTPGGSSTVHIYTQTVHSTSQWDKIHRTDHTLKKSSHTIGNRTRELPVFSAVSQPTAPPRAPIIIIIIIIIITAGSREQPGRKSLWQELNNDDNNNNHDYYHHHQ
jgi:hypothetical protein